jgi:CheY-like chemotaxis protein
MNLRLVKRLLEKHGFEVYTAENGLEGLQLLQASLSGAPGAPLPPAVVLTDMQMCVRMRARVQLLTLLMCGRRGILFRSAGL